MITAAHDPKQEQLLPPMHQPLRFTVLAILVVTLALPIVAHGCHTNDHDDEPSATLHTQDQKTADPNN